MDNSPNVDPTAILAIAGIWSLVAIAYYVWYLWSLSRLFPYLGLPSWAGWVPLWNQWQLIQRGGLPGWLVLLGLIPGLGIVVLIVTIIAISRINAEHGRGAGFTVLGIFILPLWAMLLANHIRDAGYADRGHGAAYAGVGQQQGYQAEPQGYQQPGGDGWQSVPPAPQQFAAPPAAPQQYAPPAPVPPVPAAPAFEAPAPQAPAPQAPGSPLAPPAGPRGPAAPPAPAAPQPPQQANAWGFSHTTEGAFERLASEEQAPRSATPFGASVPPQPFSWPEPQEEFDARPAHDQAPAPGTAHAEPVAVPDQPAGATIFDAPGDPAPPAAAAPAAPIPVPAALAQPVPAPAAPATVSDDSDDRTVVVQRRVRWGIELPDGEVLELDGDDVVVGRKPEPVGGARPLQIADPTRTMSKTHARMRRNGEDWTIEDLQSTNGVALVDESGEKVPLEAGREYEVIEQLVIGTLEVRLRRIG